MSIGLIENLNIDKKQFIEKLYLKIVKFASVWILIHWKTWS